MTVSYSDNDQCVTILYIHKEYRIMFTVLCAIAILLSLFLLIVATLTLRIILRNSKLPIYKLLIYLHFTQLFYLFPAITAMLPCTYCSCEFYSTTVLIILSLPDTFGFYTALFINCLIAVERISMFLLFSVHRFIEHYTILYCSSAVVLGIAIVAITNAIGCYKW